MAGEIVVEYTGELVRRTVADAREREYAAASGGMLPRGSCYMFAIDAVSLPHACCRTCMGHAATTGFAWHLGTLRVVMLHVCH